MIAVGGPPPVITGPTPALVDFFLICLMWATN